jgi:subtilisin family serine protease
MLSIPDIGRSCLENQKSRRPFYQQVRKPRIEQLEQRDLLTSAPWSAVVPPTPVNPEFEDVVVWLDSDHGSAAESLSGEVASIHGGRVGHVYQNVPGFSASLPKAAINALRHNPKVVSIEADSSVFLQSQITPTGVDRADVDENLLAAIDGVPGNANDGKGYSFLVATLDSGIDVDHPDLNVAGGRNFLRGADNLDFNDGGGHGTHVAGIIGAVDNDIGVVGVAPGAGIYATKVFGNNGSGEMSDLLAAMDHIVQERRDGGSVAVVNMSYTTLALGETRAMEESLLRQMAELGIVPVAAAGNSSGSGSMSPGSNVHVVSVAALADSDGLPGGLGPDTSAGPDDTIAEFSNCCGSIDVAAPGTDILSTWPKGSGYKELSGTSMAAPHVTGAAALFIAEYADAWSAGLPGDLLDTVLVREAITGTARLRGDFVTRQDDPARGMHVLRADGDWVTPPVVSIISEVPTFLQGNVALTVDARDVDTDPGDLEFEIRLTGTGSVPPVVHAATYHLPDPDHPYGSYDLSWDATGIGQGEYELAVVAIDGQGIASDPNARLTSNRVAVTLDDGINDPPTVAIVSPLGQDEVSGSVALQAEVYDDGNSIASVKFQITDASGTTEIVADESTPATLTDPAVWTAVWDTTSMDNGSYLITALATDTLGAGGQTDAATEVVVNNEQTIGSLAVSDLDGTARNDNKRYWRAIVRAQVRDVDGDPVEGATVYGNWLSSGGSTATTWSETDAEGWIEHHFVRLIDVSSPVRYTIDRVEHPAYTYQPLLNSDPDQDSIISEFGEMTIFISREMAATAVDSALLSLTEADPPEGRKTEGPPQPTAADLALMMMME